MAIVLGDGDLVKVVNNEAGRVFTVQWGGRKWKLEPEKAVVIPFEAYSLWFGDPRSSDVVSNVRNNDVVTMIPDRESEKRRLAVKYGDPGDGSGAYPKVTAWAIASGGDGEEQQITGVMDDPDAETVALATPPTVSDSESARKRVDQLEQQLNDLRQMIANQGSTTEEVIPPTSDEADGPPEDESNGPSSSKGPESSTPHKQTTNVARSDKADDGPTPGKGIDVNKDKS